MEWCYNYIFLPCEQILMELLGTKWDAFGIKVETRAPKNKLLPLKSTYWIVNFNECTSPKFWLTLQELLITNYNQIDECNNTLWMAIIHISLAMANVRNMYKHGRPLKSLLLWMSKTEQLVLCNEIFDIHSESLLFLILLSHFVSINTFSFDNKLSVTTTAQCNYPLNKNLLA